MPTIDDPLALMAVISQVHEVLVFDDGLLTEEPIKPRVVLRVVKPGDVTDLLALLGVSSVTDGVCMCAGSSVLEFRADGRRLAIVGLHHGSSLRWSGWHGDARLSDGLTLVEWLAARGYGTPLEQVQRDEARRSESLIAAEMWAAAAPASVHGLMPSLLQTSQTGRIPAELVAEVAQLTATGCRDEVTRSREMLAWFAAGTGRCSGYPAHEDIPGRVLQGMSLDTLIAALVGEPSGSPVWEGVLRHLASWRSRTSDELERVPRAVWDEVLHLAEASGDPDKWRRIKRKHDQLR